MVPILFRWQIPCWLAAVCWCAVAQAPSQVPDRERDRDPGRDPGRTAAASPVDPWTLESPTLDPAAVTAWRLRIEPAAHENAFEDLGWLPTLWEGVQAAQEQQKPLLLWVMNGHPLACT